MVTGRPKTDLEKLAKELIEWSYQADALNLIGFSSPRRFSVTQLPEYAAQNKGFSEALKLAKENIAQNRFRAANNNQMIPAFYTRCEGMYDPLFNKYDNEEKDKEAARRKDIEGTKQQFYTIVVPNDLAVGTDLSAKKLPTKTSKSAKQRD